VDVIHPGEGPLQLAFGSHLIEPAIRRLYDLRAVAFDTAWMDTVPDRDIYYMYRDLARSPHDREIIEGHELRYDITTIPPLNMGHEFVKTFGHYHPRVDPEEPYTYPEVYEVLEGDAHYLLQRRMNERINDIVLVRARKGDKVIIPPNYGHVTINPSEHQLTMANWVCRSFESVYEPYEQLHGAAYYELVNGRLLANRAYGAVPDVRETSAPEAPEYGLVRRKPMYELLEEPQLLDFLTSPERHAALFYELYPR